MLRVPATGHRLISTSRAAARMCPAMWASNLRSSWASKNLGSSSSMRQRRNGRPQRVGHDVGVKAHTDVTRGGPDGVEARGVTEMGHVGRIVSEGAEMILGVRGTPRGALESSQSGQVEVIARGLPSACPGGGIRSGHPNARRFGLRAGAGPDCCAAPTAGDVAEEQSTSSAQRLAPRDATLVGGEPVLRGPPP